MANDKRLIEVAFPLKQVSLDSVHEKNVRHGHISTLHIWPARRPLAAARAALIATLLPDPGNADERKAILKRMAGTVVETTERKRLNGRIIEKTKEVTEGGILHWGRENGEALQWFRDEIRNAYDGRAPKVLDPFAGGGAIPLEAMRLGCEVTAMDINPVAWFILKCTLEYPQKLAGQTQPLPEFAVNDRGFMESFLKAKGYKRDRLRTALQRLGHGDGGEVQLDTLPHDDSLLEADLAWHVRAWGRWVLAKARAELATYYPTYAECEPLDPDADYEPQPLRLLEVDEDGIPQIDRLNTEFDDDYLKDRRNPRWIAKPTVAYLWARTVTCKGCRATLPLLKTRWLCKKERKRVLLTMVPNAEGTGVVFGVERDVPQNGGNSAQRREHDKRIGAGTMSRTGATCPCCGIIMTMEDIRFEGRAGRLGAVMTAVVVEGQKGKEYRIPIDHERAVAEVAEEHVHALYADIPFSSPDEPLPRKGALGCSIPLYGFDTWHKLFMNRQLFTQGVLIKSITEAKSAMDGLHESAVSDAMVGFMACIMDRQADYGSAGCIWVNAHEKIGHQFSRYALPLMWDTAEVCPLTNASGGLESAYEWVTRVVDHLQTAVKDVSKPHVEMKSAIEEHNNRYDVIITDPPYYDAIPYSDLMDFFYIWLRRLAHSCSNELQDLFQSQLGPKWNAEDNDGELIDDASRFEGDKVQAKRNYEDGMERAFSACSEALVPAGRLVIVFASKSPDAWETLVSALIRAGFVVDGSWPIQTERQGRLRSVGSAALASSVWLVCKKRPMARPGWDRTVLEDMRTNITQQLHDFWDAGIRGPDFVWAATGPALEAFSKHPVVKKADAPEELMTVSEFLREVRRMVVDFVVGRVLTHDGEEEVTTGLDDVTTYYLLHRNDFNMGNAPVGACILYALSCNLSDAALVNQHDILAQSKSGNTDDALEAEEGADEAESGGGAKVKLKPWHRRVRRNLGLEAPSGQPVPLIDQVHKLMHLWRAGDQVKVDNYLNDRGLQRNALFNQILQALIELADEGSEERSLLEALSNHVAAQDQLRQSSEQLLLHGKNDQ